MRLSVPRRLRWCEAKEWFESSTGLSLGTPEPVPGRPGVVRPLVRVHVEVRPGHGSTYTVTTPPDMSPCLRSVFSRPDVARALVAAWSSRPRRVHVREAGVRRGAHRPEDARVAARRTLVRILGLHDFPCRDGVRLLTPLEIALVIGILGVRHGTVRRQGFRALWIRVTRDLSD